MALNKTMFIILEENAIEGNSKLTPIADAVKNRNPITFNYSGPRKVVKSGGRFRAEGVALGLNKKGNLVLRAYIDTPSRSKRGTPSQVGDEKANYGWRTFLISRMSNVVVMDQQTFDIKRPKYQEGDDRSMSVTYVKSDWGKKTEVPVKQEPQPIEPEKPIIKKKPIEKPIATTEPTTTDVTPQTPEKLPQPKPKTKPTPVEKPVAVEPAKTIEPIEPTDTAVKPQVPEKLPQPKPKTKPIVNPEVKPVANTEKDIEDKNLQESILKIKRLMFS